MSETERYSNVKEYINKRLVLTCTYNKYGLLKGESVKSTCLRDIKLEDGTILADHIWITDEEFVKAKLRTGQALQIEATIRERVRPSKTLFDEPLLDIKLGKPRLLKLLKGKRR